MTDYRIDFTIQRREDGDDDFEDIGFGSSGSWDTPTECAHMVDSAVQNGEWETELGMPDPEQVVREVRGY